MRRAITLRIHPYHRTIPALIKQVNRSLKRHNKLEMDLIALAERILGSEQFHFSVTTKPDDSVLKRCRCCADSRMPIGRWHRTTLARCRNDNKLALRYRPCCQPQQRYCNNQRGVAA